MHPPLTPAADPFATPLRAGGRRGKQWAATVCRGFALAVALTLPGAPAADDRPRADGGHEFYFTRGIYGDDEGGSDWGPRWAVDYPKADEQFLVALRRLTLVDAFESDHALSIGEPALRDFPFLYVLEVGSLSLSDAQAKGLREYLLAGAFMVVDDFWGSWAWENFEEQMRRVFPNRTLVEVPLDHPVFHAFYDVSEVLQVPNVNQAAGGPTWEYDGRWPHVRGIFDDEGRLMVLANWNTDLGDAWEWADLPGYPLRYSTYAFEIGINFVIYGMSY